MRNAVLRAVKKLEPGARARRHDRAGTRRSYHDERQKTITPGARAEAAIKENGARSEAGAPFVAVISVEKKCRLPARPSSGGGGVVEASR